MLSGFISCLGFSVQGIIRAQTTLRPQYVPWSYMETLGFVVVLGATFFESTGSWIKDIGMHVGFHDSLPSIYKYVYLYIYIYILVSTLCIRACTTFFLQQGEACCRGG